MRVRRARQAVADTLPPGRCGPCPQIVARCAFHLRPVELDRAGGRLRSQRGRGQRLRLRIRYTLGEEKGGIERRKTGDQNQDAQGQQTCFMLQVRHSELLVKSC